MTTFTYNPSTLTQEQLALIAAAQEAHDERIAELQKDEDKRMEHYYDCMDDYSWGGPCSKANAIAQSRTHQVLNDRIEEIVRGGYLIRTRRVNALRSIATGEIVSVGTHEGTYGRYFRTYDGQFVSVRTKVSTYEKKGYKPIVQTITEKVVRDGAWPKSGDLRYKFIETISVEEEVSTEIVYDRIPSGDIR